MEEFLRKFIDIYIEKKFNEDYKSDDEMHIELIGILLKEDHFENYSDETWENLKNSIEYFDDDLLYSLYLYQFYFSDKTKNDKCSKTNNNEANDDEANDNDDPDNKKKKVSKFKITNEVRETLSNDMRYPKLSFLTIYQKPKFQEILPEIYNKFKRIYKSIKNRNLNRLDYLYIFSWIFFPYIYNEENQNSQNEGKGNNKANGDQTSEKGDDEEESLKAEITRIIMTRFYNDLPKIYDDLDTIQDFFSDLFQIEKLDSFVFADENNDFKPFSFPQSKTKIITYEYNFAKFPNIGYAIPPQCIIDSSTSKCDLDKIIEVDVDKKFNTAVIDDINSNILHSNLFKEIIRFLLSDGQREKFYFFGNLFQFAAQLTLNFYKFGILDENLISNDDPILNGLSSMIIKRVTDKNNKNIDILYDFFINKMADELVKEGEKILQIPDQNKDESLLFKMQNSVMIGYRFSAKIVFEKAISDKEKFFIPENDDKEKLFTKRIISMLEIFSQKELFSQNKDDDDENNYENEIVELINLKGFYYHFFILRTLDSPDCIENKIMLSSYYKILKYLDEFYMKIFSKYLFNCSTIDKSIVPFCEEIKHKLP